MPARAIALFGATELTGLWARRLGFVVTVLAGAWAVTVAAAGVCCLQSSADPPGFGVWPALSCRRLAGRGGVSPRNVTL
jgi:hypothetical protein